jgi:hypothetical protein
MSFNVFLLRLRAWGVFVVHPCTAEVPLHQPGNAVIGPAVYVYQMVKL